MAGYRLLCEELEELETVWCEEVEDELPPWL